LPYRVRITDAALADARDYVRFVRDVKKEPAAAERWYRGLLEAVFSLEELPSRCPLIPEATLAATHKAQSKKFSRKWTQIFGSNPKSETTPMNAARRPLTGV
jgi:plasmid stabilization system protein ParE